jgi:hypothetical protein
MDDASRFTAAAPALDAVERLVAAVNREASSIRIV